MQPEQHTPKKHTLGVFEGQTDLGTPHNSGSCVYSPSQQIYTVAGFGASVWNDQDSGHFVWKRMHGNFIAMAHAAFFGMGMHPHRQFGWMVRSGLNADSPYVGLHVYGNGRSVLQFRSTPGNDIDEIPLLPTEADVFQIERIGAVYRISIARYGETFVSQEIGADLGDEVYLGMFVRSHDDEAREQAIFRNVRIVRPAPEGFVRTDDSLGSLLEILELANGSRRIVHSAAEVFEAPNWTPDGQELIYNSRGRLYRFDLQEQLSMAIDTGFATRCNNDHVISFDGTLLAISHYAEEDRASIIYTLPIEGGTPKRVTAQGPSYLHGWSPDGKYLVYAGLRNGDFDIYRIPAEGGEETRLTDAPGLDDGPEYSPDGAYIYFNSVRSGTMQIWRMKADGSNQEQLTDDEYNNWFPHVSPDGRWIVFLTYADPVAPSDHPAAKRVYLRLMAAEGGKPQVVAYLYGGQGTINVPSWSPDSKRLAFVSNTVSF